MSWTDLFNELDMWVCASCRAVNIPTDSQKPLTLDHQSCVRCHASRNFWGSSRTIPKPAAGIANETQEISDTFAGIPRSGSKALRDMGINVGPPPITGKTAFVLGVQTAVLVRSRTKHTRESMPVECVVRAHSIADSCFCKRSHEEMVIRVISFVDWFYGLLAAVPDWLEWESGE